MDAAERKEILSRYVDHSRRFEAAAKRRGGRGAEVIPFSGPLQELYATRHKAGVSNSDIHDLLLNGAE